MPENKKTNVSQWLSDIGEYLNKPLPPLLDIDLSLLSKRTTPLVVPDGVVISVVIPAWNEEAYIARTLDALHRQTFPRDRYEIVVVDNVCTDRTVDLARAYGADKVVFEPCKGTNYARQRGIEESVADIIAFLDADCIPPPEWLEKIYIKLTEKNSRCAAIAGSYVFRVNPTDSIFLAQEVYRWIVMPTMSTLFGRILGRGGVLIGGNFASFRENFKKINGLDTSFTFFGDDASIARKFGEIGYVEFDPLLYVLTSTRRFEREGLLKTNWNYTKHFFKVMFDDNSRHESKTS